MENPEDVATKLDDSRELGKSYRRGSSVLTDLLMLRNKSMLDEERESVVLMTFDVAFQSGAWNEAPAMLKMADSTSASARTGEDMLAIQRKQLQ